MFKEKIKELGKHEDNNKKKIENIAFLVIILIVTIIIINIILKDDSESSNKKENQTNTYKTLATNSGDDDITDTSSSDLETKLENILSTIKGVGEVKVFINYCESSKIVAMYDEKTTTNSVEETDSSGGIRNTVSSETQKDVIYSEEDGNKTPVTEKVIMPTIEGAIITAQGASSATVKSNIVSAVEAATGLSIDKIQVFEMK